MGHWDVGKAFAHPVAANLALKGFVVLVYDRWARGEVAGVRVAGRGMAARRSDGAAHAGRGAVMMNGTALIGGSSRIQSGQWTI